jgi:glutathione S-transferase
MRTLYQFPMSPFSRRTRLALAHKKIEVVLKDARADAAVLEEAKKRWPLRTMPVLVEDDGRALGDSTAITHYLDAAYPSAPRVWPTEPKALLATLEITTLVDGALDNLVNTGTRFYPMHEHAAWAGVQAEAVARAQGALDTLGERAAARAGQTMTDAGWCAADMWLYVMTTWLEGLPGRKGTHPNIDQLLTLPWKLPSALKAWAESARGRDDVKAAG